MPFVTLKKYAAAALALLFLAPVFGARRGAMPQQAAPLSAEEIIVKRALRLAFLGQEEGGASWTPHYSFYACNVQKKYEAFNDEYSMPYSRSALFNSTEFVGLQQYVGWVDPDSGMTPSYAYSITNFLGMANTVGSDFDRAARAASEREANWGALLGSDCSAFLSYAWQIPHMTTYMFTSDAVDWNICRTVPFTRGHESAYTYDDLNALMPGDAMICCNQSGVDEHGNPLYRGHCIIITAVEQDPSGKPVAVRTVEEISPRAIAKNRTADEFLEYANKLHSSGAYYKFYRLISKKHLKLELEISLDTAGGEPLPDNERVAFVSARDAAGGVATYDELIARIPAKAGGNFLGWGLERDGNDIIEPGTPIAILTDHKLYARWG